MTLLAACTDRSVAPPPGDVPDGLRLARAADALLMQLTAYDYALAGTFSGQKTRIVSADRWATLARGNTRAIGAFNEAAIAASAGAAGPVRSRLVALADSLSDLANDATAYGDGRQPGAFAAVVGRVSLAWQRLADLESTMQPDPALEASLARARAIVVTATRQTVYALTAGPFGSKAEAEAAARTIGRTESATGVAPFVVRVGTYPSRAAADVAAAALKGVPGSLVVDEPLWTFARSGPAPDAELWREPARVVDLPAGARRVSVASDGQWIVTGGDDGTIALFSGDGVLRALPKLRVSIAQLAFSDDGKFFIGGGVNLVVFAVPQGSQLGSTMELTSPATQVLFVPGAGARAFVASSKGPTGVPAGGAGAVNARAPDGALLGAPFPVVTPAAGSLLATSLKGELYVATPASGGQTDIEVVRLGAERTLRAVARVPGVSRALAVDRSGTLGAILTDQGVYTFRPADLDPAKTVKQVLPAVRDVAFGTDGILYALEATRLSALDRDGKTLWSAVLSDGRRLVAAARAAVIDGLDKVLVAGPDGTLSDLGVGGTVQDLASSLDGRRIAAVVDARRAVVFDLP